MLLFFNVFFYIQQEAYQQGEDLKRGLRWNTILTILEIFIHKAMKAFYWISFDIHTARYIYYMYTTEILFIFNDYLVLKEWFYNILLKKTLVYIDWGLLYTIN